MYTVCVKCVPMWSSDDEMEMNELCHWWIKNGFRYLSVVKA